MQPQPLSEEKPAWGSAIALRRMAKDIEAVAPGSADLAMGGKAER